MSVRVVFLEITDPSQERFCHLHGAPDQGLAAALGAVVWVCPRPSNSLLTVPPVCTCGLVGTEGEAGSAWAPHFLGEVPGRRGAGTRLPQVTGMASGRASSRVCQSRTSRSPGAGSRFWRLGALCPGRGAGGPSDLLPTFVPHSHQELTTQPAPFEGTRSVAGADGGGVWAANLGSW